MSIKLGDEVKDSVTGFGGIAVCRHSYLQGCDRISVQPPLDKKTGEIPEPQNFDEPQIEVIKKQKVKRKAPKENPGGPEKYKDQGRIMPKRR